MQCVRNMSNADRVTYIRGNGPVDDHDFHHANPTVANKHCAVNSPIDDRILKVQELFRQATHAAGSLTPSSFTALNVRSIADKLSVIIDSTVRDAILQLANNLKIEDESLTIESIDVALCTRHIDLCDQAIALWKTWHGTGLNTLLCQDEKKGEEAQQPLPVSPDVIVMSIKCFLKTIPGHTSAMNNLSTQSPQTLINFGKNLRVRCFTIQTPKVCPVEGVT